MKTAIALILTAAFAASSARAAQPPTAKSGTQGAPAENARQGKIRKVTEMVINPDTVAIYGAEKAARMATPKVVAVDFVDDKGAVRKRVDVKSETDKNTGKQNIFEVSIAGDGKSAVVWHGQSDPRERNPFRIRRSSTTEVTWYDINGEIIGRQWFGGRAFGVGLSSNGAVSFVADFGFDPEALYQYVTPDMESTAVLTDSPDLVDHFLHVITPQGKMLFTRGLEGPGAAPNDLSISPSGRWFMYGIGTPFGIMTVIDLQTGKEESFRKELSGDWQINDSGEIYGWVGEKNEATWIRLEGRIVGKPGKRILRKYKRALGEPTFLPTAETMERW